MYLLHRIALEYSLIIGKSLNDRLNKFFHIYIYNVKDRLNKFYNMLKYFKFLKDRQMFEEAFQEVVIFPHHITEYSQVVIIERSLDDLLGEDRSYSIAIISQGEIQKGYIN